MATDRSPDTAALELDSTGFLTNSRLVVTAPEIVLEKRMGRKEVVSRADVAGAVRARSVYYGEEYSKATDWFLLVDASGNCLMRLTVSTWGQEILARLVDEMDLPVTSIVDDCDSKWRINQRYPGSFNFFDRHPQLVGLGAGLVVASVALLVFAVVGVVQEDRAVDRQIAAASAREPQPSTRLGPTYEVMLSLRGSVAYDGTFGASVYLPPDTELTCSTAATMGNWLVGSSGGPRFRVPTPGFVGEKTLRGNPWAVSGHSTNFDVVLPDYAGPGRYTLSEARVSEFYLDGTSADKRYALDGFRPSTVTVEPDGSGAMSASLLNDQSSPAELSLSWTCRDPAPDSGGGRAEAVS